MKSFISYHSSIDSLAGDLLVGNRLLDSALTYLDTSRAFCQSRPRDGRTVIRIPE